MAQTPNMFKYQAVLRDADGTIMTDENASVYLEIPQGSASGTSVFNETHNVTTTAQGLINIDIGSEEDMSVVDWSTDIYFIKITVNGTEMGTSQLLSVPYALHAETVENTIWTENESDIYFDGGNVGIGTTTHHNGIGAAPWLNIASNGPGIALKDNNNVDKTMVINNQNGNLRFDHYTDAGALTANFMYFDLTGNLGIGTTSPSENLDIYSLTTSANIELHSGNSSANMEILFNSNGTIGNFGWDGGQDAWYFMNGNVGIGSYSPAYPLDITGNVNTTGSYLTNGSDFAEYFVNEEELSAGDIAGINLETGKVRKYQVGDELVGIVSNDAGYVGNNALDRENDFDYTLVGLSGQLEFDETQVIIENRIVKTIDGIKIGVLLANDKVFIR